jgi:nucleoside-diphosphate-sugar epimerase
LKAYALALKDPAEPGRYGHAVRIVIAGGHGQIAMRLEKLLTERGDSPVGIIRNPKQAEDLRAVGADPAVCDLESASVDEVASHLEGADAVVFAAGAGPGSGAARKETVDRGAAALLANAAERAGVRRYLMISAMGADAEPPPGTDPVFAAYLRAKGAADADLTSRAGLNWTILRPGRLTDEPSTGLVQLAVRTGHGTVPRDDVATVLLALLDTPAGGMTLELVTGDTPVAEAVRAVASV